MNCKPGDLAYVVGSIEEAGMVVEVIRAVPKEPHWPDYEGPFWSVCSRTPMLIENKTKATRLVIPDEYLRPISGVPVNDEVTEDLKEPA